MTDYQQYINALRKCAKEHESDRTFTGHIIVSDLCKDTANLLETLEQESFINKLCVSEKVCEHDKQMVLDKIRAEIESLERFEIRGEKTPLVNGDKALDIIDKYKADKEQTDGNND